MSREKLVGILDQFGCYKLEQSKPPSQLPIETKKKPQVMLPPELQLEPKVYVYKDTPKTVLVVEDSKINRVSTTTQ